MPPLRSFGTGSKESGDNGGGQSKERDDDASSGAEAEEEAMQRKARALEEANRSLLAASEWIVHPIFSKLKSKRCGNLLSAFALNTFMPACAGFHLSIACSILFPVLIHLAFICRLLSSRIKCLTLVVLSIFYLVGQRIL